MKTNTSQNKSAGGRPRKFKEASKPITITLPLRTLDQLDAIGPDRARAIAKLADSACGTGPGAGRQVDTVEVFSGKSLILVGPSRYLKQIKFLHLAEITPTRFLLAIPSGTALESLELAIADLLENIGEDEPSERKLLTELLHVLKTLRRNNRYFKAEMIFVRSED